MNMRLLGTALITAGLLAPWQPALAANKPLSNILETVTEKYPGTLTEAELDKNTWEIKSCDAQSCVKAYVNPTNGEIRATKNIDYVALPNKEAEPLLSIVKRIEAAQIGEITEIEFKRGQWEIELRLDQAPRP